MRMLPLLFLFACPAPKDPAGEEEEEGTESEPVDSDGDGLLDDDEIAIGSDPEQTDSDGDGWLDGDEVDLGTNPIWEYSHPFDKGEYSVGSCPVLPDESIAGANGVGASGTAYQEGDVLKNFTNTDSYGQEITPYAFCGNYTLLTMSAIWCGPCQQLASQMPADMEEVRGVYPNFGFYELLYEDAQYNLPSEEDLAAWRREFDLTGIPVVAPQSSQALYLGTLNATGSIPSTLLIAPDMTIIWSAVDHPRDYYLASPDQIITAIEDYEASL